MDRKYVPKPSIKYPLGKDKLVNQRELYLALTDFDGKKQIAEVTDPVLFAAQTIRDTVGTSRFSLDDNGPEMP